jgi:hypothetical protein
MIDTRSRCAIPKTRLWRLSTRFASAMIMLLFIALKLSYSRRFTPWRRPRGLFQPVLLNETGRTVSAMNLSMIYGNKYGIPHPARGTIRADGLLACDTSKRTAHRTMGYTNAKHSIHHYAPPLLLIDMSLFLTVKQNKQEYRYRYLYLYQVSFFSFQR